VVAAVVKCERNCERELKSIRVSIAPPKNMGHIVHKEFDPISNQQQFTTEDILWTLGIWSVILTLSPVIIFYILMVG
jgi:hypothetical protein